MWGCLVLLLRLFYLMDLLFGLRRINRLRQVRLDQPRGIR